MTKFVRTDLHFTIDEEPGYTKIVFGRPFDQGLPLLIKASLPPAAWFYTPDPPAWHIVNPSVLLAQTVLKAAGHRLLNHTSPGPMVLDALFDYASKLKLDDATFRVLARGWHPDNGGNSDLMADLIAARDRLNDRKNR